MEDLVLRETAILAQEKGFNWPCPRALDPSKEDPEISCEHLGSFLFDLEDIESAEEVTGRPHYLWPSQGVLAKWLRMKGIETYVVPYKVDNDKMIYQGFYFRQGPYLTPSRVRDTWQEALEEALKDALDLLSPAA